MHLFVPVRTLPPVRGAKVTEPRKASSSTPSPADNGRGQAQGGAAGKLMRQPGGMLSGYTRLSSARGDAVRIDQPTSLDA
jgi:hypothetical protein